MARGTSQQRDRKERKSRRMGKSAMKDSLLELAWHALMSSSRQSSFQQMEEALTTPLPTTTLPEKLLAADGCCVKENQCSVVDCPCPHGNPTSLCVLAALKDSVTYNNNQGQEGWRRDHVAKGAGRRSGSGYYQDIYIYEILKRISKKIFNRYRHRQGICK